jgi:hypothetical protein
LIQGVGSNPLGDANIINLICAPIRPNGSMYGKYTAKVFPDADGQARTGVAREAVVTRPGGGRARRCPHS